MLSERKAEELNNINNTKTLAAISKKKHPRILIIFRNIFVFRNMVPQFNSNSTVIVFLIRATLSESHLFRRKLLTSHLFRQRFLTLHPFKSPFASVNRKRTLPKQCFRCGSSKNSLIIRFSRSL